MHILVFSDRCIQTINIHFLPWEYVFIILFHASRCVPDEESPGVQIIYQNNEFSRLVYFLNRSVYTLYFTIVRVYIVTILILCPLFILALIRWVIIVSSYLERLLSLINWRFTFFSLVFPSGYHFLPPVSLWRIFGALFLIHSSERLSCVYGNVIVSS